MQRYGLRRRLYGGTMTTRRPSYCRGNRGRSRHKGQKRFLRPRGEQAVGRVLTKAARRRGKEEIRDALHLMWLDCELNRALGRKTVSYKSAWSGLQHLEEIVNSQELRAELYNAAQERELWDSLFGHDEEPLSYIDTLMRPSTYGNDDAGDDIDDGWDNNDDDNDVSYESYLDWDREEHDEEPLPYIDTLMRPSTYGSDDAGDDIDDGWDNFDGRHEPSPMSAEWKQSWLDGTSSPDNNDNDDNDLSCESYWDWDREEDIWEYVRVREIEDGKILQFPSDAADERNAERGLAGDRYFQTAKRTVRKYGAPRNGADSLKKPSLANTSRKALRREKKLSHG